MNEVSKCVEERIKEYERYPGMKELIAKLRKVPGSYTGFVAGVIAYTSKSPKGLEAVMNYIDTVEELTTSDVVRFISEQTDFLDYCVDGGFEAGKEQALGEKNNYGC